MNEDNANAITQTPRGVNDAAGSDTPYCRQTARQYLTRWYRANAMLTHLKTNLRGSYSAIREAHPIRTEARVLLVEWLRLAGREWIHAKHPAWQTIYCFLGDLSSERKPIVDNGEMLALINGARLDRLAPNATTRSFLIQLERLTISTRNNAPVS
ncbi:hypothetical protein [Sedimenticola selenatireducens]|uniref:hypothetical protein n=1 Tax=Sedimenticola selenatireducens TaxID=191960 RepID=UPI00048B2F8E|nr:hypothetical protein [Sedimenticola selenatireducens]